MALAEESLFAYLVAQSTSAGSRIYPVRLVNSTMPAVTYQRLPLGEVVGSHSGATGQSFAVFQLTAWGSTYAEAKTLADELKRALAFRFGAMVTADDYDQFDPEAGLYQTIIEVKLWQA